MSRVVLGINAFHGDSSAALVREGSFCAGIEEERLNRIKHWAGFPRGAVAAVLAAGEVEPGEVEHVAVSRDPSAHRLAKVLFALRRRPGFAAVRARLGNHRRIRGLLRLLREAWAGHELRGRVHAVEHHRAHLASSFYCSPFEESACLTIDGFGDFLSSVSAVGRAHEIEVQDEVPFPHSLGILYTAVTQFLGFPSYGDEYKVMGLAAYGAPAAFLPKLRRIVRLLADGRFETDPAYFVHATEGITMSWEDGEPRLGPLWSRRFVEAFGAPRRPDEEITERHRDLAASLQAIYEEAFFHRLNALQRRTRLKSLCLAGGCAFNSVANGKIFGRTDFSDVYIQAAAGDAGTALGAAQYVWHQVLGHPRRFVMEHSYWGPEFGEQRIVAALAQRFPGVGAGGEAPRSDEIAVHRSSREDDLIDATARALAAGRIVGWYQGRTEWGPRALGNRSILADPRRAEMKDALNLRIKRRESFRPFAPSILEERVGDYFEIDYPDPFMMKVYPIRPSRRPEIPAVTHVDGTGRLQTVSQRQNPRFWALLRAFGKATGVPVLLNTSFNENEPIVNTPEEALDCFLRTGMDLLVLGDWMVERCGSADSAASR